MEPEDINDVVEKLKLVMSTGAMLPGSELQRQVKINIPGTDAEKVVDAVSSLKKQGYLVVNGPLSSPDSLTHAFVSATPKLFWELKTKGVL